MLTKTRSLPWSSSIDSMLPKKSAKGPSVIFTASPRLKLALYLGAPIWANCIMASTSSGDRGVGLLPVPTKPVMPLSSADYQPGIVVDDHFDQQVSGKDFLFNSRFGAVLDLDFVLGGD